MSDGLVLPWDFSEAPKPGGPSYPNEPTAMGRALGLRLAWMVDVEEVKQRERFPDMLPRCDDCAARAGTLPNGCEETLMDLIKCAAEGGERAFYCHKGVREGEEPKRLCTGFMVLLSAGGKVERPKP